jgi:hypothetical protein
VVITEKTGRIATQAIQAWIVLDGQGALLLLSPEKKGLPNRLRYYELDAGKGRLLGRLPLQEATIAEHKPANDQWAFALSGVDPVSKQPVIFAGDTHAVHARIDDASQPQFSADSMDQGRPEFSGYLCQRRNRGVAASRAATGDRHSRHRPDYGTPAAAVVFQNGKGRHGSKSRLHHAGAGERLKISSLAQIDPVVYLFLGASGPAVLGFAEPEILYNAGTELTIEFHTPVITAQTYPPRLPRMDLSGERQSDFDTMLKALPYRTKTEGTNKVSDITNLIFIGKASALRRAFDAAGWGPRMNSMRPPLSKRSRRSRETRNTPRRPRPRKTLALPSPPNRRPSST